jgi:hypothetical protein
MQKLKQRTKKNTPTNASQVRSNCDLSLNRDQSLSVASLKTCSNNPEVNLRQANRQVLPTTVFVLSLDGEILMPTKPSRARKFIQSGKAKVIKNYPFTIQLTVECENKVQEITLGIDSGYSNIGFSCVTQKQELISGTLALDDKTSDRLTEKRMYRSGRRNKLWYRKPRFNNRKKREGWLPPSIQRRYDSHLSLINHLKAILPITEVIIETANFDIQKIENVDIEGTQYQQGDMFGYQNVRSYLMAREHGLCQLCGKEFSKGNPSHIHHCKPKSESGSNRTKNLALLHEKCHIKLHKQGLKLKPAKQYKPNTFMSIIRNKFWNDVPDLKVTYGYITFLRRQENGITKSHNNDAFVIAGGTTQHRCSITTINQKHRNNRAIQLNRKGFKPSIRKQRYKIQPYDFFWVCNKKYLSKGIKDRGYYITFETTEKKNYIKTSEVTKVYNFGSFVWN